MRKSLRDLFAAFQCYNRDVQVTVLIQFPALDRLVDLLERQDSGLQAKVDSLTAQLNASGSNLKGAVDAQTPKE